MLKDIYGVTANLHSKQRSPNVSVYHAFEDEDKVVILQKIALKGESPLKVGGKLDKGNIIGIMADFGFQRYDRYKTVRVDGVNSIHWGGGTNNIVALFKNKRDAMKCFKTKNLTYWDDRFLDASIETLNEIGTEINIPINVDERIAKAIDGNRLREFLIAAREPR